MAAGIKAVRYSIIFNPAAGRRRSKALSEAIDALSGTGARVDVYTTIGPRDAEARAASLARDCSPKDVIVAAGGDGTVREVVSGLMKCLTGDSFVVGPRLGLLPLGTTNILARELGISTEVSGAVRVLSSCLPKAIRIGVANDQYFISALGAGVDAQVVQNVSLDLKRKIGKGAYVFELIKNLTRPKPLLIQAKFTGDSGATIPAASVIVSRSRYYAGSYSCAPDASVMDGALHVCLFTRPGRINAACYAFALGTGQLARTLGYRILSVESVVIEGPRDEPVQADGDLIGMLPVVVSVAERPLSVLAPGAPDTFK